MKNLKTLSLLLLITSLGFCQEIKWITLDEALKAQKTTPKPIFMDVFTDWCGPCKMLDAKTFHDKKVVEYITKNYYAVKFNAEGNSTINYKGVKYQNPEYKANQKGRNGTHNFTNYLVLEGYPTMVVFSRKGDIIKKIVGFHDVEQLLKEIK